MTNGMENDSSYVDRDLDTKEPRQFLVCRECPLKEECSLNSWKRACCRSLDTERLYDKVREHLMGSGLHNKSAEEADDLASSIEIDIETETYEEREAYRLNLERIDREKEQNREQKEKGKNKGGGKGKEKGKGKDKGKDKSKDLDRVPKRKRPSSPSDQPRPPPGHPERPPELPPTTTVTSAAASRDSNSAQLCEVLKTLSDRLANGALQAGSGASSSASSTLAIPAPAARMLQVPLREMELLYAALTRARRATLRNLIAADSFSKYLEAICSASKQWKQEGLIIERAQAGLRHLLMAHGAQSFLSDPIDDDM